MEKKKENKHIFLASPHMSERGYQQEYIKEAFATNRIAPLGANVNQFEKELSKKVGARDAAALNAGIGAIHLALKEADVVFCHFLTFSATASSIT